MGYYPILEITDGTAANTINLITPGSGIKLDGWEIKVAGYKGGGISQESLMQPGSELVYKQFDTVTETLTFAVDDLTEDALFERLNKLFDLLEAATGYWTNKKAKIPVYLKVQSGRSANPQYALIHKYNFPQLGDIYSQPFLQFDKAVFSELDLSIERSEWLSLPPNQAAALAISCQTTYNNRTLGPAATTTPAVVVANKWTMANITHIFIDDGGVFSSNLMDATPPFNLFPATPAVNDALYVGISTAVANNGPFNQVVFDLANVGVVGTIGIEYGTGASTWAATTFQSYNPLNSGRAGVQILVFTPPTNWVANTVNGVTAYWLRFRVVEVADPPFTIHQQRNRLIYSATRPYVQIAADQVQGGAIPSLFRAILWSENENVIQRLGAKFVIGLRSLSYGSDFSAFLPFSDTQLPVGISTAVSDAGLSSVVTDTSTPSGRAFLFNPTAANDTGAHTITIDGTVSEQYEGEFHAFARIKTTGTSTIFTCRLAVQNSNSVDVFVSKPVLSRTVPANTIQVLDFGQIKLPTVGKIRPGEQSTSRLQLRCTANNGTDNLTSIDLILMPVDELYMELLPGRAVQYQQYIDIDGIKHSKFRDRAFVKSRTFATYTETDQIQAHCNIIANSWPILQSRVDQRLWVLQLGINLDLASLPVYSSNIEVAHVVQMQGVNRFLGIRGAR